MDNSNWFVDLEKLKRDISKDMEDFKLFDMNSFIKNNGDSCRNKNEKIYVNTLNNNS